MEILLLFMAISNSIAFSLINSFRMLIQLLIFFANGIMFRFIRWDGDELSGYFSHWGRFFDLFFGGWHGGILRKIVVIVFPYQVNRSVRLWELRWLSYILRGHKSNTVMNCWRIITNLLKNCDSTNIANYYLRQCSVILILF